MEQEDNKLNTVFLKRKPIKRDKENVTQNTVTRKALNNMKYNSKLVIPLITNMH